MKKFILFFLLTDLKVCFYGKAKASHYNSNSKAKALPYICSLLFILYALLLTNLHATKLNLSSDIEVKAVSYKNLIYGPNQNKENYIMENTNLGFIIKNIRLEKTRNSLMDVGIVINSIGIGSSSNTVSSPQFQESINRYSHTDGTPFIKEAYIKIHKIFNKDITATFGRQCFKLGQGIVLSDNGIGMTGARFEIEKLYKNIKAGFFGFRIWNQTRFIRNYGVEMHIPSETVEEKTGSTGLWHVYYLTENDKTTDNEIGGYVAKSRIKNFAGIRYLLNYKQLNFDGEFVMQRGSAEKTLGGEINYTGYAFLMKSNWSQKLGFLGKSIMRFAYGKSSGNSGSVTNEDKAFFPSSGHRFNGIERVGFGEIIGASLYDIIKTSNTLNGLPDGVSGLNIINIGADLPYKKLILSLDLFRFRAAQNVSSELKKIGQETDLKITYPLSEDLKFKIVYAVLLPQELYPLIKENTKLMSFSITAKF